MTLRQRTGVLLAVGVLALATLGVARRFTVDLVEIVVEHSLVQKSEGLGMDPEEIRRRLRMQLSRLPGREEKLSRLFEMARLLEKVQRLDRPGLERLVP